MWPWEHAIIGYLAYTILVVLYRRRPPSTTEALIVVVGTQVPDLVDKPLAWTLPVLPNGRSLGHSLLTWSVVAVLVVLVARRVDRLDLAPAFLGGYLSHLVTDLPASAFVGDLSQSTFLLWPILPSPTYDVEPSILLNLARLEVYDLFGASIACAALLAGHATLSALLGNETTREGSRAESE